MRKANPRVLKKYTFIIELASQGEEPRQKLADEKVSDECRYRPMDG